MDTRRKKVQPAGGHPLLGEGRRSARGEWVFEAKLSLEALPYLADHRIHGLMVLPAPVYLEMAAACGKRALAGRACALLDFSIREPFVLPEEGEQTVQLIATPNGDAALAFEIFSRNEAGANADPVWTLHATGTLAATSLAPTAQLPPLSELQQRGGALLGGSAFYDKLQALNIAFGPSFRGLEEIWRRDGEALGRILPPESVARDAVHYTTHPALLDACFQLLGSALPGGGEHEPEADSYLMVGLERIFIPQPPATQRFWAHAVLRSSEEKRAEVLVGDIVLADETGAVLGTIEGLRLKRATRDALLRSSRTRFDDWLYEVRWLPKAELSGGNRALPVDYMPAPAALKSSLQPGAADLWRHHQLDSYVTAVQGLEKVSFDLVLRALTKLGWKPQRGERVSGPALASRLGVVPAHRRLVGRLLEMLGENKIATREGDEWLLQTEITVPPAGEPEAAIAALRKAYPAYAGEFSLLWNCGIKLAEVLAGTCDPLEILFPGGSMVEVEKLTQNSPAAQAYNELVARAVDAALAKLPPGRIARVVEVGAGTGGTTSAALPKLSDSRVEYVFTDVSQLFLAKAQQKFKGRERMRFALLNAEKTPESQGFEEHSFDVVLAANVLHATKNLRETMRNVRRLLAPGGMLVLLEGTGAQRWVDLTFGLTEGWWRFNDYDLRTSHPLLSRETWTRLLDESGFTDTSLLPEKLGDDLPGRQTVILCRNPVEVAAPEVGTWLLVADGDATVEPWRTAFKARGQQVHVVAGGQDTDDLESLAQSYRAHLRETLKRAGPLRGIIHLVGTAGATLPAGADVPTLENSVRRGCISALAILQAAVGEDTKNFGRLWLMTHGALPSAATSGAVDQSPLWGFGRTMAVEHPEFWGGLIDLADSKADSIATAVDQMLRGVGEDQLAIAGETVSVGRLVRCDKLPALPPGRPTFRPDVAYLVTGGFGGMGRKVLDWMAEHGARHIAVIGRSIDPARPDETVSALGTRGVVVLPLRADVADAAAMDRVFAVVGEKLPTLAGVIHIAGIFDDRVLARHDWPRCERVMKPKVAGGWNLHQRTKHLPLDFFVLFSSGASFLAPVGLGNYAAGNAFLDALAHHRRALGLPGVSINWGPWAKVGMADAVGDRRENQWTQGGFATMTPQQGLDVLQRLMHKSSPQVGVLIVDWPKYLDRFGSATPPLYKELRRVGPTVGPASTNSSVRRKFEEALPTERRHLLFEHVCAQAAEVLGFGHADELNPDQGLFDLGMDSLTAVELKNRLQTTLGQPLPSTLLFDHPNVQKLTEYMAREVFHWNETPAPASRALATVEPAVRHDDFSEDELADLLAQKLQQLK